MKAFFGKLGIFLILLWVGSYIVTKGLDSYFRQNRTDKQLWSLSQHDRSLDYAIAGSSRALHNVDAATFHRCIGGETINLGYDGQSIIDIYLTTHLFLAHQNQVRRLVLQLDGWDLSYTHKFLDHLYSPYANDYQVAKALGDFNTRGHGFLARVFPGARYAQYNDFYTQTLLRQARSNHSTYDETSGSELLFDDSYHVFPAIEAEPEFVVDHRARRYLDQIVELATKRGIELTIFSAPIYHRDRMFEKYDEACRVYIEAYCRDHDIAYLDFTAADFDRSEFRDYSHLNGRGALRFTEMLAQELVRQAASLSRARPAHALAQTSHQSSGT